MLGKFELYFVKTCITLKLRLSLNFSNIFLDTLIVFLLRITELILLGVPSPRVMLLKLH